MKKAIGVACGEGCVDIVERRDADDILGDELRIDDGTGNGVLDR